MNPLKPQSPGGLQNSADETELSSLMSQALDGNQETYRQALLRMEKMLQSLVRNSLYRAGLGEQAAPDDLVQDILLAIHHKRHTYDRGKFFLPWMYAIARYKIIDFFRRSRVEKKLLQASLAPEMLEDVAADSRADHSSDHLTEAELAARLGALSETQRRLITLVKIKGLSIAEAAQQTGLSEANVKVIIHRAMTSLKERAQNEDR